MSFYIVRNLVCLEAGVVVQLVENSLSMHKALGSDPNTILNSRWFYMPVITILRRIRHLRPFLATWQLHRQPRGNLICLELVFIIRIGIGFINILIKKLHRTFLFSYTNLSYLILFKDFMHIDIVLGVCLLTMCVPGAHEAQKRVLDTLALESHAAVASHPVGAGNRT